MGTKSPQGLSARSGQKTRGSLEEISGRSDFGGRKRGYQFTLTTVTLRQPELPAASKARIVTVVFPINSGTAADQLAVPDAMPELPLDVLQATETTPTLSEAVPAIVIEDLYTETMVDPGDTILSDGGTVSLPPVG